MKKSFHKLLGVSILPALLVMPAMAADPITNTPVFVLGDITLDSTDQVAVGKAAFAGRRMDNWQGNRYQNDFPKYKIVVQSLSADGSDMYVGPVTLDVRKLKDNDSFTFNWQDHETDIDLAGIAGIGWNESYDDEGTVPGVLTKISSIIGHENAGYTAPTVYNFSQKDDKATKAGVVSFKNTTAMVDGSTLNANTINVSNGSVLTFSKQDHTKLTAFLEGDIDSDGVSKLNADTINVSGSSMEVKPGAKLVINKETEGTTTIKDLTTNFGALTVNGAGSIEIGGDSLTFDNNKSKSHGAGLYFKDQTYGNGESHGEEVVVLNAKKITFSNNEVINADTGNTSGSGAAIFVSGGKVSILGDENKFIGNKMKPTNIKSGREYKVGGGAIANQSYDVESGWAAKTETTEIAGTKVDADMIIGKTNSVNKFESNESVTNGGAIMNRADKTDGNATLTINGLTTFKGNHADLNGGAIYNVAMADESSLRPATDAQLFMNGSSLFSGNTADGKGGAIYNAGAITLAGSHKFTGNTANNVANDIHNIGTLTIASGTTTIDGGITGESVPESNLIIAENATLNIGTASIEQQNITLNGQLSATLDADRTTAQIKASTFSGNGKLALNMAAEGTYHVFGRAFYTENLGELPGWDVSFANSSVYHLVWGDGTEELGAIGDVTATRKTVTEIATNNNITNDAAATISHVVDSATGSSSKQMQDLSIKLQEKLASGNDADKKAVEHATKAIHPETESVTQSVASSVQNTVVNLASARMAAPIIGRSGGDVELTGGGVWFQGLLNKTKQNDAFDGTTRGIAVGLDRTINHRWTVGLGYSFARSDINGTARDTDVDSNTVFLYGQYKPSEWYINAIANYTVSDYSEKGTVIDGKPIFADYKARSFGGSIATGYDFALGITPELGLRYMHVSTGDYANSYGIKTHVDNTNFLTGVFGAKYAHNIAVNDSFTFAPQLKANAKYDMVSDKNVATVTMPGVNAYSLEGSSLNRFGGEFGIGLGAQYKALQVSLNYDLDVRKDYTSHTGMLKFRCNF